MHSWRDFDKNNDVVIPRVEMAVRLITGSSGNEPNSIVKNPDRRDLMENSEKTPLRLAWSRLELKSDQDLINEHRDIDNSMHGESPEQDSVLTGKRVVITWWQDITTLTTVFPSTSQAELKLKITHGHNILLNRKT